MTLIQLQDAALAEMAEPRTSERRARKHRCCVLRRYEREALALGYTAEQARAQVRDLRDMHQLHAGADE